METAIRSASQPLLLEQLAHCLAAALGFEFALVGLVTEDGAGVTSLATVVDGRPGAFEYRLLGTPCARTLALGHHVVDRDVVGSYPDDQDLVCFGACSYAGARFEDPVTGRPGLVVGLSRSALERPAHAEAVVRTFAASAQAARTAQMAVLTGALAKAAIEGTDQGYLLVDGAGTVVFENEAAQRMLPRRSGGGTAERFGREGAWVLDAVARGERVSGRLRRWEPHAPGARSILAIDVVPVGESSERTIVLMRDATSSIEREERLGLALDASGAGLWDWSIDSGVVATNANYMAMLGEEAREAELSIAEIAARLHPDDVAATFRELSRTQACPDQRYDVEFRMRCRDGAYKWVRSAGRVVERGPNAEPLRMIGYHIDIDARRRVEQQRTMLERHLQLFFEHTEAAIAMFDRDMRYMSASRGWYEQYGLVPESVVGRSHYEVFPDLPPAWLEHHRRALAGEVLTCERDSFERADGSTTHLSWTLHPWRDANDRIGGIVMFTQVVDEQVRHEQGLRDARDAAIAASRARGEFLANMSHEIRTPMTAMLGFADQLELEPQRLGEYVEIIRRNGRHLMEIVDSLLDLSKIDAGKMSVEVAPVGLAALVQDLRRTFQARAEEQGLALEVLLTASSPAEFGCDPLRLRQILTNLVGNAIKFTPSGSVVVRVGAADDGRRLVFEVADTGIGMSPEQMARVFEPFEQGDSSTTRRFGGTGLGLCISRRLAELLGGTLAVESRLGAGTTFRLDLPLLAVAGPQSEPTEAPLPALPTRSLAGRRILLADDGADNRRLVGLVLARAGAAFRTVENGSLVRPELERAQAADEPYDLVLMDMQMPELDGYAATSELRSAGLHVPVVALTAHAMSGDRERCLAAGCDDYLSKPIDRAELVGVVARLLERASARPT